MFLSTKAIKDSSGHDILILTVVIRVFATRTQKL